MVHQFIHCVSIPEGTCLYCIPSLVDPRVKPLHENLIAYGLVDEEWRGKKPFYFDRFTVPGRWIWRVVWDTDVESPTK